MKKRTITLIAGPTASGKSDFALKLAEENDAVIVNADSMQIYDVLNVITARPSAEDTARVQHYLYGYVSPEKQYSTGKWLKDVAEVLKTVERPLIFVGGTGLYFKALTEGLAIIPDIPEETRKKWRTRLEGEGASELYKLLQGIDYQLSRRLSEKDGQRIIRALEVHDATGKTLSYWQNRKTEPLLKTGDLKKLLLLPERDVVYRRIERRFDKMVENGALEEARALDELGLNPSMPAMKAIGIPEFIDVLKGKKTIGEAIVEAKTNTRRYAKRQMTWFRHQLGEDWEKI